MRNLNPGSLNSPSLFLQYTPIPINYLTTQFCEIFKIQTRKYHLSLNLIKIKAMIKLIYKLVVALLMVCGPAFSKTEIALQAKPIPATEKKAALKKWEASPDGIQYKKWEASPAGKKVHASYDKIKKSIKTFATMEAVVTSVTFQRSTTNASVPKWLIVQIDGEKYMMQYVPKDFEKLKSLKVNDKISVKSRSAGFSSNHPYLILSGDYIAKDNTVLFKREVNKNHC